MFFCLVLAMPLCASVYRCRVVTCWERADLLALVCGGLLLVCYFAIGILMYRFLIFAHIFTSIIQGREAESTIHITEILITVSPNIIMVRHSSYRVVVENLPYTSQIY